MVPLLFNTTIKYFKLFIIFIVIKGFLFSSPINITGQVLNINTQMPISDANVYIEKYGIGTTTDNAGLFNLHIKKLINNNFY